MSKSSAHDEIFGKDSFEQTAIEREREQLFAQQSVVRPLSLTIELPQYLDQWRQGNFVFESGQKFWSMRLPQREVIPVKLDWTMLDLPRTTRKQINAGQFSVSTDQCFDEVLTRCAAIRPSKAGVNHAGDQWIGIASKHLLVAAFQMGACHSVEIWRENNLVGGLLALQFGAAFISLSVFSNHDGAGNAVFAEMLMRLSQNQFQLHDAILPSNISRFFGGQLIDEQDHFFRWRTAMRKPLSFPVRPAMLPARLSPTAPSVNVTEPDHGRPFPR